MVQKPGNNKFAPTPLPHKTSLSRVVFFLPIGLGSKRQFSKSYILMSLSCVPLSPPASKITISKDDPFEQEINSHPCLAASGSIINRQNRLNSIPSQRLSLRYVSNRGKNSRESQG